MAITWDSTPVYTSEGYGFRVGLELTQSPTTVTASTTSVTVTVKRYMQTRWAVWDNTNVVSWSGDAGSGSTSFVFSTTNKDGQGWSSENIRLIGTSTRTVTPSYAAAQTTSVTLSMSGVDAIPGTSSVTASITTPKRPVSAPAAPTNVLVVRSSDAKHTVKWTLPAVDAGRPVTNVIVRRWDHVSNAHVTIATVGNVSSYVDSSTVAGRQYRYSVAAKNTGGQSAMTYSGYFYTTPPAPTSVKATKTAGDITLTWVKATVPGMSVEIAHSTTPGSGWEYPGWTSTGTSYLMKTPDPSVPHLYAVRTVAGALTSGWVHSNTVQLLTPPAAVGASFVGAADADNAIPLAWVHQSIDTTAQTAFELRWRPTGATTWNGVPKTEGSSSTHFLPAGTWAAGATMEWQVRTWGEHADPSLWSATALTAATQRPSATITAPTTQSHISSRVRAAWDFFDPEGSAQRAYAVALYAADGETILWEDSKVSGVRAVDVGVTLQDGMSYVLGVSVQDSVGLWSQEARQQIDVTYAPPPSAAITPVWDMDSGTVTVSITHPQPTASQVPGVSCELWQSTAGQEWTRIAKDLPLDTAVVDQIPAVAGATHYRVVTLSDLPSTAQSQVATVTPDAEGWVYLNTGPGWTRVVRMCSAARLSPEWGRQTAFHHMDGAGLPISVRQLAQSDTVGVQVRLAPAAPGSATFEELHEFLATSDEVIVYRDPKGRRWFVDIPGLSGAEESIEEEASFTVTRIGHDEEAV